MSEFGHFGGQVGNGGWLQGGNNSHKECPSRSQVEDHSCKKDMPCWYYYHSLVVSTPLKISTDPGLRHGRGGAWDHRRCGTFLRGSFHQGLWPSAFASTKLLASAFAAPGLQPALCLHIPRGSFHQAPGRQRSALQPALCLHIALSLKTLQTSAAASTKASGRQPLLLQVAACPLPAHSPLLLGHSSLPFASLQTLKTPIKPSAAASTKASGRQPLLPPSSWRQRSSIAACPLPAHSPLLLRHSSLPFASLQTS